MSLERSPRRCVLVVGVVLALVVWPIAGSIGGLTAGVADNGADETGAVVEPRAESFAGGTGTAADPYQIATVEQLQRVDEFRTANFTLVADIDASKTTDWNDGKGFEPIGNGSQAFTGAFDGDGHTVSGLRINRSDEGSVGLFGRLGPRGTIDRVELDDVDITGSNQVGGLVGYNDGTVRSASASGTVTGSDDVGGLIGLHDLRATVRGSHATSSVIGSGSDAGGLVGSSLGLMERSYATGDVTGNRGVGGLVGYNVDRVRKSYATGNVTGDSDVGGLIGYSNGRVQESYAAGSVTGTGTTGGLIGFNAAADPFVRSAYWDGEATGQSISDGGTRLTTAEMAGAAARENMSGFDFENTWVVGESEEYPGLQGSGDDGPSRQIGDWNDLDAIREDRSGEYNLTTDLDETTAGYEEVAGPDANGGSGFEPIGNDSQAFTGTFDGNGHTISGLYINRSNRNNIGLFGVIGSGGTIHSVGLDGVDITGNNRVGGLVGYKDVGTVRNASASGAVNGSGAVGGLVGLDSGPVRDASASVAVTGSDNVGGLVGANLFGTVRKGTASGAVNGSANVGGLVGYNPGTVRNGTASGAVTGSSQVGGLVGQNGGGTVRNGTASGAVNGSGFDVGGLVGSNSGTVRNGTASGAVNGSANVGGLVGINSITVRKGTASGAVNGSEAVGGLVGDNDGTVSNASASGAVTGSDNVGGLVGDNFGTVRNGTASGAANGSSQVGGLVGDNTGGTVRDTFATGTVAGSEDVGGLVGFRNGGTITGSYWDVNTTGQPTSSGGTGLTTARMTGEAARENMSALDFEGTWVVGGPDEYPRLRALDAVEENDSMVRGLEITDIQLQRYLRNEEGRRAIVNVTNRGVINQTETVRFSIPTEEAPIPGETVSTVRFRENVTFEPLETKTFEFRLPAIELEPPSDGDFEVEYSQLARTIELTNDAGRPLLAGEVIVDGTNLTDVDEQTPLSAVTPLDPDEILGPGVSVELSTTSDAATLRVLASERINSTIEAGNVSRDVGLYLLPDRLRPIPRIRTDKDPAFPVTQPVRFEVGGRVASFFFGRADETAPDLQWEFFYPSLVDNPEDVPDGIEVPEEVTNIENPTFEGIRVIQAFAESGPAGASVTATYPDQPETTFRTRPYRVGSPEEVPPIITEIGGADGVYLSDPDDELEPVGETTISETFEAQFVAPDQIQAVTFAPGWIDGGNVTDTDGSDGWSATFDVSEIPVSEDPGPDAELDVVAVDEQGRTVETVGLYATDPPLWAELIYLGGGEAVSSTDGRVAEAITIPPGGFDAQVEPPDRVPIVGGKELGLSGNVQYGVETYQLRQFAARYGEGNLGVDVPVSGPVSVNQSVTIGAAAEYGVPSWRLNGNARFYVLARTLLTAEEQVPEGGIPEGIPVVGGDNVTASAYVGPGYGFELRLSGITGGNLNIEEGLGYANVTAGVSAAKGVAGQEVFVSVDGEIEGNTVAEIDNDPNRFQRISLADADFGGSIEGAIGARINAPGIGGEYAQSITLAAGSADVEQPGPPFDRVGASLPPHVDQVGTSLPPLADEAAPALPAFAELPGPDPVSTPDPRRPERRAPYDPVDGRLTDNGLNDTDPAVAGSDGDYAVAWSGEATDRPHSERQEVYVREYVDGSFGDRVRLTDDAAYNVDPTVARADGTTLVAWARIESDALDGSGDDPAFQDVRNRSEIAYAVDDGSGWSEPRVLTNDGRYQGAPAAAAYNDGFVIAYERDGDFDYTTREDTTVRYTRVTPAGRPARNGTLGDGHSPRAAPAGDGEAVRVAREHPDGDASILAVVRIDGTGVETGRQERLGNLTTFDVASGGVAWATGGASDANTVTVAGNGTTRTVPVGTGTAVRELRVATTGNRTLLQYQGANPTADNGFMPNSRTTYYQLFRGDAWSPPRTVEQAVDTERTIYDHAVTTDDRSFVSVAGAVAFGQPGAVDELHVVDHEYRPDLTVSIPADDRASLSGAGVGETVTLNVTVANTGDVGTGDPAGLSVTDGTGTTTETVEVGAVGAGDRTTVTVTTTVTRTGVIGLVVDPGGELAELSETNNGTQVIVERPRLAIVDTDQSPTDEGLLVNATLENVGPTNVTGGSVGLANGDATFTRTASGLLQPGETRTVTFEPDGAVLNRSALGRITARATAPTPQRSAAREQVPLFGAAPTVAENGVRAIQAGGETFVTVPVENRGLAGTKTRLEVRYGDRVRSRQVCVPPATADRPTAYRRALVAAPGLAPGQPVVAALSGSENATVGATTSATEHSTVSRVRVQSRAVAPLPVVSGRVPTDADCDGIAEDFDGDGAVTDGDLRAFFERRGAETLRVQRPRFDANDDSLVDVHDVQAVLASVENRSGGSPDGPTGETEPDVGFGTDGTDVPTNGTRTVDIVVPDVPVGAVNLTVRARDDAVSVVDVGAPGSDYEAHPRNRTGESVLVAAGNGDGERIATVTLAGESEGETGVVVDVADISDDEGSTYATPQDAVLSVDVSTDDEDGDGNGGDGDGEGGDGNGDGNGGTDSSDETESGFGGPAVLIVVVVLIVAGAAGTYYLRRQR